MEQKSKKVNEAGTCKEVNEVWKIKKRGEP
jgi:hypothetical protein